MGKAGVNDPVTMEDFEQALQKISPSVNAADITKHMEFAKEFGAG